MPVTVCTVVHEPGVAGVEHGIPAVGLGTQADVVEVPAGVEHKGLQRVVPVVAPDRAHAHDVHRVTAGAEPGDGRFGADGVAAARRERPGVDHRQVGRRDAGQVLGDDQAVVQHDEGVVGLVEGQFERGLEFTTPIQPVRVAAVNDDQMPLAVHSHAARPHRSAGQPRRTVSGLQADGVDQFHARRGGQPDLRAQGGVGQQVDLARRAQHGHRRHERAPYGGTQGLSRAQAQPAASARHLEPVRSAVLGRPGAGGVAERRHAGRRRRRRARDTSTARAASSPNSTTAAWVP